MIRKLLVATLALAACSFQTTSNIPSDGRLVPAIESGRWGYVDREGSWKITPAFKSAELFSGGLAAVRTDAGWGFVDQQGDIRIQPRFGAVGDFKSGIAPVRVGRRWGFVDTSGKWVVEPKYQTASEFHEGLARVEFWDKVCGAGKDDAPENLFQRQFTEWNNIPAAHCGAENSRIGYVDTNGVEIIVPQYLEGSDFSEGRVQVVDRSSRLFGYIDKVGKAILPFQYVNAGPFSEGVASVVFLEDNDKPGRATVINREGRKLFPPRFVGITKPFSEGLAPALLGRNPLWVYIAPDGVTKIPGRFRYAMPFSEGLAVVWIQNRNDQAYIDTTGNIVFRVPSEGEAESVKNGIAVVKYPDNRIEYFDKSGRKILPKSR